MSSFYFFFSSRRRHTRCGRDWSSDVCSSDLPFNAGKPNTFWCGCKLLIMPEMVPPVPTEQQIKSNILSSTVRISSRSEERRVGKSVDLGGCRIIKKKKTGRFIRKYK